MLTRNGQFSVDSEMNLVLPGAGLVLDDGGAPITLDSSSIRVDAGGGIRYVNAAGEEGDEEVARIGVYVAEDTSALENAGQGFYRSEEALDVAAVNGLFLAAPNPCLFEAPPLTR